jgi:AraC family transcriptional regulator, regulatory protein of adaptative response / DNA-3-methyladenine glycosylase II
MSENRETRGADPEDDREMESLDRESSDQQSFDPLLSDVAACYRAFQTRDVRFDGRLFCGVKTTGIYCRPVCPARTPKPGHVTFFVSAAAAQAAGFRPCLRCRPETAPDTGLWRGTSNTVRRALSLIERGALNDADVDALAERLGVGARQLRRLFDQHLGASPIAVAQTRRVLLAKQLIHETRLPMAEVALAAGYGSIRRFNETFRQLFGRPPGALRRGTAADVSSGPAGQVTILLRYRPPYDWPAMLAFLRARAIPGIELVSGDAYARTVDIDGVQGTVRVQPAAERAHALRAAIRFPRLGALPAIIARLRRVFDLAADPETIGAHLAEDPALASLVAARPGLRVPGAWDGFELAVRAVLGQQITVSAAVVLAGKLAAAYGEPISVPDERSLTRVFPRPECLASVDLSTLGMPKARAAALSAVAAAVVADPQIFGPTRTLDAAITQLRAINGIGEWTAHYIAMRAMREPDAFPAADIGLLRALADTNGQRPTARDLLTRAERWRPWRAYAAQHLWAASAAASATTASQAAAATDAANATNASFAAAEAAAASAANAGRATASAAAAADAAAADASAPGRAEAGRPRRRRSVHQNAQSDVAAARVAGAAGLRWESRP